MAGIYFLLPLFFESRTSQSLSEQYATTSAPEVDLYRDPTSLLSRDYDGGRIVLPDADFGAGVRPDRVTVELAPFQVDLVETFSSGQTVTEAPLSGTLRAELSEEEVSRLVQEGSSAGSFPVLGVDVEEGRLVVYSEALVFGQVVPVSVTGSVSVGDGATLVFEPGRAEAAGFEVPEGLTQRLLRGTSFVYPIEELPEGVVITGAEAEEGRLVLTGEASGLRV